MPTAAYFDRLRMIERVPPEQRLRSYQFHFGASWRWRRAQDLAGGQHPPDPVLDCATVWRAAQFLRRWRKAGSERAHARSEFPDVYQAWKLSRASAFEILGLQARLLSGQGDAEIAAKTGVDVATVGTYQLLFFACRDASPRASGWIYARLIKLERLPTLRSMSLILAYHGGPLIADAVLGTLSRLRSPLKIGHLVRGDPPFSEGDWGVVKALTVNLLPRSQKNSIGLMVEYARLRAARRPEVSDSALPSTLTALQWRTDMDFARLVKPHLDDQVRNLRRTAAA